MQRIARSCEADPDRRRDLLQEMHVALWKSYPKFDGRCSEKTWVYRIASNVSANYITREKRTNRPLVSLDTIDEAALSQTNETADTELTLQKLYALIAQLKPPDASIMTLYLEGLDANTIGEVTGISPGAIATRISRVKTLLARMFKETENV